MLQRRDEINKYPFSESSTMVLNESGYTLPIDLFLDACVYPRCDNNAPFYVASMDKWLWTVKDSLGNDSFVIAFDPAAEQQITGYFSGYCYDKNGFCGSVLGSSALYSWLRAVPAISGLSQEALVFSAGAVKPLGVQAVKGNLLFRDTDGINKPVFSITWGANISNSCDPESSEDPELADVGTICVHTEYPEEVEDTAITKVIVNGVELSAENIYISPKLDSKVRVITDSEIRIGKVTELV